MMSAPSVATPAFTLQTTVPEHAYGELALLADPFGNGFCPIEFTGRGYDEITLPVNG